MKSRYITAMSKSELQSFFLHCALFTWPKMEIRKGGEWSKPEAPGLFDPVTSGHCFEVRRGHGDSDPVAVEVWNGTLTLEIDGEDIAHQTLSGNLGGLLAECDRTLSVRTET